jgi:hypothetical protein
MSLKQKGGRGNFTGKGSTPLSFYLHTDTCSFALSKDEHKRGLFPRWTFRLQDNVGGLFHAHISEAQEVTKQTGWQGQKASCVSQGAVERFLFNC